MKRLYWLQTIVLFAGVAFSGTTVFRDFSRFFNVEGTLFKIKDCAIPNPVTTPCFYGAIAFLIAFVWSVMILRRSADQRNKQQQRLHWLLIASVLFAWSNFGLEVKRYLDAGGQAHIGCSGALVTNPLTTPCFIGSAIFLLALIVSLILLSREKKQQALLSGTPTA